MKGESTKITFFLEIRETFRSAPIKQSRESWPEVGFHSEEKGDGGQENERDGGNEKYGEE